MMKKVVLIFSVLILMLVTGCARVSKAPESSSDEAKQFVVPEGKGVVYLYRTGKMVGAALQYLVKVNGVDAGGTGPGTFFRWELNPGVYTFFSSTTESSSTVQVNVEAGKMYFLKQTPRLGLVQGGRIDLVETDEKTGKKDVAGLKLLVSAYIPE